MSLAPDPAAVRPPNGETALPLYARIRAKLRMDIASGHYAQGDQLPPAEQLARKYGANKNTILRALRMLRSEGVIDFGRGRGAVVLHSFSPVHIDDICAQLQRVVNLADASGISRSAVISSIERMPRVTARNVRTQRGPLTTRPPQRLT
ncbi:MULTISPECIES: GntR family transcriptional regulator [Streptomyces]|uniref:Winged helix-turn-helix transcriptional regulator n=3 Tax=Streptomyces rimosus TaxID=1927 RepID=L8EV61_STRR1|nr:MULTISPECIES: winged helix-turn-helix domain-containing protein [Streptomyces]KOG73741.1 transcriptional regulator, GntR family protein [Kitasatospora aureofaciens]KWT61006.1 GntR family transcriptional regulator [Streptomyces albus subsp. albus]MYT45667.1 GntR family transcriptional regulator [Streptomyces sp. SID5471]KEF03765.1 GntR family transcriptional regulator [Streptomyces rimosus]KEF18181.1 GntR family transcriptional regulator [Streptomyces rimosus]